MPYFLDKMVRITFDDILFWILIALMVGVAIWKLVGSPTDTAVLISVILFVATSEILIWKAIFKIDNNVKMGFMKVRHEMNERFSEVDNRFSKIDNKLNEIRVSLSRRK